MVADRGMVAKRLLEALRKVIRRCATSELGLRLDDEGG